MRHGFFADLLLPFYVLYVIIYKLAYLFNKSKAEMRAIGYAGERALRDGAS